VVFWKQLWFWIFKRDIFLHFFVIFYKYGKQISRKVSEKSEKQEKFSLSEKKSQEIKEPQSCASLFGGRSFISKSIHILTSGSTWRSWLNFRPRNRRKARQFGVKRKNRTRWKTWRSISRNARRDWLRWQAFQKYRQNSAANSTWRWTWEDEADDRGKGISSAKYHKTASLFWIQMPETTGNIRF